MYNCNEDNTNIICTVSHPIYCMNKGRWCCVEPLEDDINSRKTPQLCVGDMVMKNDGKAVRITNIERKYSNEDIGVYTLHIDGVHNYFANGVLAHNGSPFTLYLRTPTGKRIRATAESDLKSVNLKQ